jgi:hypothetical protein
MLSGYVDLGDRTEVGAQQLVTSGPFHMSAVGPDMLMRLAAGLPQNGQAQ